MGWGGHFSVVAGKKWQARQPTAGNLLKNVGQVDRIKRVVVDLSDGRIDRFTAGSHTSRQE
tara:strand:- start:15 stop:197 length:183 start_codon:yes stop_codon:yes gene_type:complete